jgi:site-specific DNA-adenine methylase
VALLDLDPPYPHETWTARDVYDHEMDDAQHIRLIGTIPRCRGMVVVSR